MKPAVENPEGPKDVDIEVISYRDRPNASPLITCGPAPSVDAASH